MTILGKKSEWPEWDGLRLILTTPGWKNGEPHWGKDDAGEIEKTIDAWREREGKLRAKLATVTAERDRLREALLAVRDWGLADGDGSFAQSHKRQDIFRGVLSALEPQS